MAGYAPGGFSPEFSDDFVRGVDSSYLCKTRAIRNMSGTSQFRAPIGSWTYLMIMSQNLSIVLAH